MTQINHTIQVDFVQKKIFDCKFVAWNQSSVQIKKGLIDVYTDRYDPCFAILHTLVTTCRQLWISTVRWREVLKPFNIDPASNYNCSNNARSALNVLPKAVVNNY